MSKPSPVDLAQGILDHQLVDADGENCGKVDELELRLDGDSPQVAEILVGGNAWRSSSAGDGASGSGRRGLRALRSRGS